MNLELEKTQNEFIVQISRINKAVATMKERTKVLEDALDKISNQLLCACEGALECSCGVSLARKALKEYRGEG